MQITPATFQPCSNSYRLGFGCGSLLRLGSSRSRQQLLSRVFESGIRYFDVARSYGFGQAEQELGRFVREKRSEVFITTKFGLETANRMRYVAAFQGIIRKLLKCLPAMRMAATKLANSMYAPKEFSVAKARDSLAVSLRELRTDYIDCLLLHDATPRDQIDTNLVDWLEAQKSKRIVRSYGMSGDLEHLLSITDRTPELGGVLQFGNDLLNRNIEKLRDRGVNAVNTFSPFSQALPRLVEKYNRNNDFAARWDAVRDREVGVATSFVGPLIYYALEANKNGHVLFATSCSRHFDNVIQSVNCRSQFGKQLALLQAEAFDSAES